MCAESTIPPSTEIISELETATGSHQTVTEVSLIALASDTTVPRTEQSTTTGVPDATTIDDNSVTGVGVSTTTINTSTEITSATEISTSIKELEYDFSYPKG